MALPAEKPDLEQEEQSAKQREFIEPGWYQDIENERYHKSFGASSTTLKKLLKKTPAHVKYSQANPISPTPNMKLGTAVHALVLEPETFNDEIAVMPQVDGRTKEGKAIKAQFELESDGKTIITAEQFATAKNMAASVENHEEAMLLLENSICESSIYWWYNSMDPDDDTEYRQMHKVRPDALGVGHPICMDLKSCNDATEDGFSRSVIDYAYHVSAAMYLEGINQCRPALDAMGVHACTHFVFIAVESVPPYVVGVYELSEKDLALGKAAYRQAAYKYKKAKEQNWPALPGVRPIELPSWAERAWRV